MSRRRHTQSGFTIVEMIISMCIAAVLTSIAITQMRDYTRRARVSEVILAANQCKNTVAESYPVRDTVPDPGGWGCEGTGMSTKYAGQVQTSSDGAIRVTIRNLDPWLDGKHVHLVPARSDAETALVALNDLGNGVRGWICGSDDGMVRNSLPANCRRDTIPYASVPFE